MPEDSPRMMRQFMGRTFLVHEIAFDAMVATRLQTLSMVQLNANDIDVTVDASAIAEDEGLPIRVVDGVAVIRYHGPTMRRLDWFGRIFGFEGYNRLIRATQLAANDSTVVAIVYDVDTPGGTVDGLSEFADEVLKAKARKRVYAQVSGMMMSAGVYAMAGADRVSIGRTDEMGNIGSRLVLYDYSAMFEAEGIRTVISQTGPFKTTGVVGGKLTDEQIEFLQGITDWYGKDFFDRVSKGRGLKGAALDAVTDGKWWVAEDAIALGLADEIGNLSDTVELARTEGRRSRRGASRAAALATKLRVGNAAVGVRS